MRARFKSSELRPFRTFLGRALFSLLLLRVTRGALASPLLAVARRERAGDEIGLGEVKKATITLRARQRRARPVSHDWCRARGLLTNFHLSFNFSISALWSFCGILDFGHGITDLLVLSCRHVLITYEKSCAVMSQGMFRRSEFILRSQFTEIPRDTNLDCMHRTWMETSTQKYESLRFHHSNIQAVGSDTRAQAHTRALYSTRFTHDHLISQFS